MKIVYINDTSVNKSSNHLGCFAVQASHDILLDKKHNIIKRYSVKEVIAPNLSEIGEVLKRADAVLANGEGTVHHGRGDGIIKILALAQRLGKKTYMVNSVLEDIPSHMIPVLKNLDDLVIRDNRSYAYALGLGIDCRLEFDSCVALDWDTEPSTELLKGKLVTTDFHPQRPDAGRVIAYAKKHLGAVPFQFDITDTTIDARDEFRHTVANLAQAKCVITARHHGAYMCALAGVPFVVLGSNTWKIEGFLEMIGEKVPMVKTIEELAPAIAYAQSRPNLFKRVRRRLLESRLSTMDVINEEE